MLSIGGIVGLIGQMPGGAIIDAARRERLVAGFAVGAIGVAALAYAAWPIFPVIAAAATLHAMASCVLGPAIAAISLGLVGPAAIGERFGRNARFASLGNGFAAALMGACGYFLSSRSVFLATFVLVILTIIALSRISDREIDPEAGPWRDHPRRAGSGSHQRPASVGPAPAADLCRQRAAAAACQRRDAALDGGHRHDALEPVGAGADRGLHHPAAGDRGAEPRRRSAARRSNGAAGRCS